jgi:hypothetical protein
MKKYLLYTLALLCLGAGSAYGQCKQVFNPLTGRMECGGTTSAPGSGDLTDVTAGAGISVTNGAGPNPTIAVKEDVNAQTGTTYTVVTGDRAKLVTFSNASAVAVTLPQASASFPLGWFVDVQNLGAGTVTITPTTSTIDGAASVAVVTSRGIRIVSDGTNYFTLRGFGSPSFAGLTDVTVQGGGAPTNRWIPIWNNSLSKYEIRALDATDVLGGIFVSGRLASGTATTGFVPKSTGSGAQPAWGPVAASEVTYTPTGNIAATTSQAAINELDSEKQPLDSDLTAIAVLACSDGQIVKKASGVWGCGTDNNSGGGGRTILANLAAYSGTCTQGDEFYVLDQPISKRLYHCSSTNVISRTSGISAGGLGALNCSDVDGECEIVPAVVPRKGVPNTWTAINDYTPTATQAITANSNAILANANLVQINPDANRTLTSTPTIADGTNGQPVRICNIHTSFTVTLQREAALASSNILGASNVSIGPNQCVDLTFSSALAGWAQVGAAAGLGDSGTTGIVVDNGSSTVTRQLSAGSGISITNNDGVSGNPTVAFAEATGSADIGIVFPVGIPTATASTAFGANQTRFIQFTLQGRVTVGSINVKITTAGANATNGMQAAIYDSTCANPVKTNVIQSLNATGARQLTFSSAQTIGPGTYFMGFTTDDTTVLFSVPSSGANYTDILNAGMGASTYRNFTGTASSNSGATIDMPSTCGTRLSSAALPIAFALAR